MQIKKQPLHSLLPVCKVLCLGLFLSSCTSEEATPEPDPIGQFLSFDINNEAYLWTESEHITFVPVIGQSYRSDNPDSIVMSYFMKLSQAHPTEIGGYWYESIDIVFNQKFRISETLAAPNGCVLLSGSKYHALFSPADWNCIGWICEPKMKEREIFLGMTMVVNDSLVAGSSARDFLCDEQPLDQSGSFFRITSSEEKMDPQRGIFTLLQGEFEMKVYLDKEVLPLKNGRFQIAMRECN